MKRVFAPCGKNRLLVGAVFLLLPVLAVALSYLLYTLFFPGRPALTADVPESVRGTANPHRSDKLPEAEGMYRPVDFTLTDEKGSPVAFSSFGGKVVVMTFFSDWSEECREEAVNVNSLRQAAEAAGAVLLIVDSLEPGEASREQALAFAAEAQVETPLLFDEGSTVYGALGLRWIPNTLFFSPEGALMSSVPGPGISAERLLSNIAYARQGGLPATEDFVLSNLINWQGAAAGSYQVIDRIPRVSGTLTAESQALLLAYAARKGDWALFDRTYGAIGTLLSKNGLLMAYRKGGLSGGANETGRDLAVLGALIKADAALGGYSGEITARAEALMRYTVGPGDTLRDAYDFSEKAFSASLALWQADLPVLKELAQRNGAWKPVYENALNLVKDAAIQGGAPLYKSKWDYQAGAYTGEVIRMEENLAVLLNLAGVDELPEDAAGKVKTLLRTGRIDAGYTADGLTAEGYGYESPGVYALCVQLGLLTGDREMVRLALERMENLRVISEGSPLDGSYSQVQSTEIPASDVLAALNAWQAVVDSGMLTGEREALN